MLLLYPFQWGFGSCFVDFWSFWGFLGSFWCFSVHFSGVLGPCWCFGAILVLFGVIFVLIWGHSLGQRFILGVILVLRGHLVPFGVISFGFGAISVGFGAIWSLLC